MFITFIVIAAATLTGDLALAGPRFARDAASATLWRRVYEQMPIAWKTDRVILVRQLTERQMDRLVTETGGDTDDRYADTVVDGCYQIGADTDEVYGTISLRDTLHGDQAAFVFAHEYGHYVWDDLLTTQQHADYVRLWRAQKRAGHLVTPYARDSAEEGFAEAFAHFLRKPDLLHKRDMRSFDFLNALLTHTSTSKAS